MATLRGFWEWVGKRLGLDDTTRTYVAGGVPTGPINALVYGLYRGAGGSVSRERALSCTSVQRGRNLLCAIATLPIQELAPDNVVQDNPLLRQIDPDVPNVVTMAQTIEDLVFESVAWWQILARNSAGYPVSARRVDPGTVSVNPPAGRSPAPLPSGIDPRDGVLWIDGVEELWSNVIRFDSPNPGVLKAAGRAINRLLLLEEAATLYAGNNEAKEYFTPTDGVDPDDDDTDEFLAEWEAARKQRTSAYIPSAYQYNQVTGTSPRELQLSDLVKAAGLDLANALGVDPEDLGISTTSRTYANAVDRRRDRINDVLAPYMSAITDRLSMPDVTRRGYSITFRLNDYLKSNPTERWNVYKIAHDIGAMSVEWILQEERMPPSAAGEPATAPADPEAAPLRAVPDPASADRTAVAAGAARATFDEPKLTFLETCAEEFTVDAARRTVEALILPWGRSAKGFRFERGGGQWGDVSRVKLLLHHDFRQAIGRAESIVDTPKGLRARFKVARGAEGDRALELAEDGVLDGTSVGVDFDFSADTVPDPKDKTGRLVQRWDLRETSLTPMPAFDDARVTKVAASRAAGGTMDCGTCHTVHASTEPCATAPTTPPATNPPAPVQTPPAPAPALAGAGTFTAAQVASFSDDQLAAYRLLYPPAPPAPTPADGPAIVNPTTATRVTASTSVGEAAPYRFDGRGGVRKGTHEFSADVIAMAGGDTGARDRVVAAMSAQFDIATGDVNELNPTRNRPEMYVDQRSYTYPIWNAVNKGTLDDITPFFFPKYSSSSGLVGPHTEGVEPTSGTFVTTNQTVTPTAVSGKAVINREAWDQGGSPQLSGLIWAQMLKGWYEALEAFAVSLLDATTPTAIALPAGAADDALVDPLTSAIAMLNFVRGGNTMRDAFTQADLYRELVEAKDADGRKLIPALGPANADGTSRERWSALDVNGTAFYPAWALAAPGQTAPASSYLFDRGVVWGWATTPRRLEFEYQVKSVEIGIWGYKAGAVTDVTGIREITYDPVA